MRITIFCLLFLSLTFSSEKIFAQPEVPSSNGQMDQNSVLEFDVENALGYLQSLHSYLQNLGGESLYCTLREKSEEERKRIQEELSDLLSFIYQHMEHKPGFCGGLASIGLAGLFLALDDFLKEIAKVQDKKAVAAKIYRFFNYLGCKDTILTTCFPPRDLESP